ncbi:BnaA05g31320D [Brassica napus]|uniref:BnaA05g31320D protein n=1 Tax=Brassica napus TaxID=3708 RepID=A0A078GSY9_BRANA|nr:BnaA05g31320D [Brassica napus]
MAPREGTTRPKKLFPERVRLRREVRPEISGQFSGQVEGSVRLLVAEHEICVGWRPRRRCVCGTRVEIRAHSQSRC